MSIDDSIGNCQNCQMLNVLNPRQLLVVNIRTTYHTYTDTHTHTHTNSQAHSQTHKPDKFTVKSLEVAGFIQSKE
jgi:hypothetical protein